MKQVGNTGARGGPVGRGEGAALQQLLATLSDPEATGKRLEELQAAEATAHEAEATANAAVAEADRREAVAVTAEGKARGEREALAEESRREVQRQSDAAVELDALKRTLSDKEGALNERETNISGREDLLRRVKAALADFE